MRNFKKISSLIMSLVFMVSSIGMLEFVPVTVSAAPSTGSSAIAVKKMIKNEDFERITINTDPFDGSWGGAGGLYPTSYRTTGTNGTQTIVNSDSPGVTIPTNSTKVYKVTQTANSNIEVFLFRTNQEPSLLPLSDSMVFDVKFYMPSTSGSTGYVKLVAPGADIVQIWSNRLTLFPNDSASKLEIPSAEVAQDTWHRIQFRFDTTGTNRKCVAVYLDGVLKSSDKTIANLVKFSTITSAVEQTQYFKTVASGTGANNTLYLDDLQLYEFDEAVATVNTTNEAGMGAVITANATALGLTLTDYNALSVANKVPVHNALVGNAFVNAADVKTAFDNAVATAKAKACDVIGVTTPAGATIGATTIDKDMIIVTPDITVDVTPSTGATWALYSDLACTQLIGNNVISLVPGANIRYIKVISQDATTDKVYTLTINATAGDPVPAALAEVNGATDVSAMATAIVSNASVLQLTLTDYNALSNKTPVHSALIAGKTYTDISTVQAVFDVAVANQKTVEQVIALITALPSTIKILNKPAVDAVRTAYNALTPTQQSLVSNYATLTNAESAIATIITNNVGVANGTSLISVKTQVKSEDMERITVGVDPASPADWNATNANPQWMTSWRFSTLNVATVVNTVNELGDATKALQVDSSSPGWFSYISRKSAFANEPAIPDTCVFDIKFLLPSDFTGAGRLQYLIMNPTEYRLLQIFKDSVQLFGTEASPITVSNLSKDAWHRIQIQFDTSDAANKKCVAAYLDGVLIPGTKNKVLSAAVAPKFSALDPNYNIGFNIMTPIKIFMDDIKIYQQNSQFTAIAPSFTDSSDVALPNNTLTAGQVVKANTSITNVQGKSGFATIVIALYKNSELVKVNYTKITVATDTSNLPLSASLTLPNDVSGCSLRAFVLDDLASIRPIAVSEQFPK